MTGPESPVTGPGRAVEGGRAADPCRAAGDGGLVADLGGMANGRRYARPLDAVDRVEVRPHASGWLVTAGKVVSRSDPYQAGHFPGLILYPAAFLLESVRQAVGLALGAEHGDWLEIGELRGLRLIRPMLEGDALSLSLDVTRDGGALLVRGFAAGPDGARVAELTALLVRGGSSPPEGCCLPGGRPGATVPGGRPGAVVRGAMPDGQRDVAGSEPEPEPVGYPAILRLIPVRHPMLLVDRVVSLSPGEKIETLKLVSGSEPCFAGLAEGLPAERYAFPRSLLVESLGQSAGVLWLNGELPGGPARDGRAGHGAAGRAAGGTGDEAAGGVGGEGTLDWVPVAGRLRGCRFHGDAYPGDVVRHTVWLHTVIDSRAAFMSGESRVGDRLLCAVASLTAVRSPRAVLSTREG